MFTRLKPFLFSLVLIGAAAPAAAMPLSGLRTLPPSETFDVTSGFASVDIIDPSILILSIDVSVPVSPTVVPAESNLTLLATLDISTLTEPMLMTGDVSLLNSNPPTSSLPLLGGTITGFGFAGSESGGNITGFLQFLVRSPTGAPDFGPSLLVTLDGTVAASDLLAGFVDLAGTTLTLESAVIPIPPTLALMLAGPIALVALRRRKKA